MSGEQDKTDEVLELLASYREGEFTVEQQQRLRELLIDDPELRKVFVQDQMMEAALHLENSASLELLDGAWEDSGIEKKAERPLINKVWPWAIAASVIFALGIGFGSGIKSNLTELTGGGTEELVDDGIAVMIQSVDAVWSDDQNHLEGSILSPGVLKLEGGLVQIEFYSGARLILDGPAELELVSGNQAICNSGRLRAFVPPHARGFTVLSPKFELVDLGTEFGVEVGKDGGAQVQVFDGEVEVYPPNGKRSQDELQRLLGGGGLLWGASGGVEKIEPSPGNFPSFEEVRSQKESRSLRRFSSWRDWNESLVQDPRVLVHYDFEGEDSRLVDRGESHRHGTVIGSERTQGRWKEKGALEFKRPGDRVRIQVPGKFNTMTFSAWLRMDAMTGRSQALVLTDGYKTGFAHWQFSPEGHLRLGVRLPSKGKKMEASGYGSPVLFSPRRIGTWNFVCTVYSRESGDVKHFLNGREVSQEALVFDQPLQIGAAEIGNWGAPYKPGKKAHVVRNFVGRIDDLTIWKDALSAEEIREIYLKTRP